LKGTGSAVKSERGSVLVTGATGFIGLNLLHVLAPLPRQVVGFSNTPLPELARRSLLNVGPLPTIEQVDVRDEAAVNDVFDRHQPSLVFHAAAVTAGLERERSQARTIVDVNIGGTQSVLDACSAHKVGRLVHVSSGAVYGPATFGTELLTETTTVEPAGLYGITKYAAEQLVRRHRELNGLDVVTARLSAAFGPWEYASGARDFLSPMLQLTQAATNGESIRLVPDQARNWMYAPDAAKVLVALANTPSPAHDCYNVCPEVTTTVSRFAERLGALLPDLDLALVDDPDQATISFDADPCLARAPVSGRRILDECAEIPWTETDAGFDHYISWARDNPSWLPPT